MGPPASWSSLQCGAPLNLQLALVLPALSHLSLVQSLVSEIRPAFLDPKSAELRRKSADEIAARAATFPLEWRKREKGVARRYRRRATEGDTDEEEGEGSESDTFEPEGSPGGGAGAAGASAATSSRARSSRKVRPRRITYAASYFNYLGPPPRTSCAGWAALMCLPRGLFSLDVGHCELTYASYAMLREHVSELQACKVMSPEEEDALRVRRKRLPAKRLAEDEARRRPSYEENAEDDADAEGSASGDS